MRATPWTLLAATWLLLPLASASQAAAAGSAHTSKSVKECNAELQRNEAALEKAGESASAFFHECWWHSHEGSPTPIEAAAKVAPPSPSRDEASAKPPEASSRHAERTTRSARRHSFRALAETSRRRRREEAETYVPAVGPVGVAAPVGAPVLPRQVNLNVPNVGSVSVSILPIPGLAATVRNIVDHPAMPGLVIPGIITATP